MYNWPWYSTEENFMNRRSRDVNLIAFSESSCKWNKIHALVEFQFTVFLFLGENETLVQCAYRLRMRMKGSSSNNL